MKVMMIGGSGAVGKAAVTSLLKLSSLEKLTLLGRRVYEGFPADPRLRQVVVDFDNLKVEAGHDVIVCALGTTRAQTPERAAYRKIEVDYPVAFARLAKAAGARHAVLVSSIGAKSGSLVRYLAQKGEVEDEWTKLGFDTLMILRPGLLGRGGKARAVEKLYAWLQKPIACEVVGQAIANRVGRVVEDKNAKALILTNAGIYAAAAN